MSESDVVQIGSPILRARASEVAAERIVTPEMQGLVKRMVATMRAEPGVGLAGPQIGLPIRLIVLEDREELMRALAPAERGERERAPFETKVIFNPVLVPTAGERATFFEGCLSVRGFVGLVERFAEVEVSGLDANAAPVTWHVRGWPARILQHEVDHLDGTLYIDRMMTRSFSTIEHAKALYGGRSIGEVLRALGLT